MSAMPHEIDRFDLLEMDTPRGTTGPVVDAHIDEMPPIELDLVDDPKHTACLDCGKARPVNESSICQACSPQVAATEVDVDVDSFGFGVEEPEPAPQTQESVVPEFSAIAAESTTNAAAPSIGSLAGGQLQSVGFSNQAGYITALRNGVPAHTHREYLDILRNRFKLSGTAIAALQLPGPMAGSTLPAGAGIVNAPAGHVEGRAGIFERNRARQFIVGPASVAANEAASARREAQQTVEKFATDMVAGAAAEGHHAIIAWEGTSGLTRGELVAALTTVGREAWAPKAPNARAQAGAVIATLGRNGLHVKPLTKGLYGAELAAGEHIWTVGRIGHAREVGQAYGDIVVKFKLSGAVLVYTGDTAVADPIVAAFQARMSAELFKSTDVTGWLSRTIRDRFDGVRFGALGWLVPARHVDAAKQLTGALASAGFGSGWVHGLPVATSDQLRDGIVRALVGEADEVVNAIRKARAEAREAKETAILAARTILAACRMPAKEAVEASERAMRMPGDIGETRATTYLKDLREIGARVVAYGQVLGEARVDRAQRAVKESMAELEGLLGEDYTGIRERFALIWEEIEADRKASGGVL